MVENTSERSGSLATLFTSLEAWTDQGSTDSLGRWLTDELDASAAPIRLPLGEWPTAIGALAEAKGIRSGWPAAIDGRATDFIRMLMRFSRPDGKTASEEGRPAQPRAFWRRVQSTFPAGDVARVLDWWFPGRDVEPVPPPLPAWSAPDRALGVLRADWTSRGDMLAFDQRRGPTTRFELFGSGTSWLGPRWSTASDEPGAAQSGPVEVTAWKTSSAADVVEWSFRSDGRKTTRLAVMLRGRRLALLADFHDDPQGDDADMHVDVSAGLTHQALEAPGAATLRPGKPGRSAQTVLIAPGSADFDEGARRLRLRPTAGRPWIPLLVSWDHARHRKPLGWSELTIAEQGARCPKEAAWAAHASWGRGETFVFYRSLAPAARRSFLGHSTTARLLVGRFTPEGDVEPIVKLP